MDDVANEEMFQLMIDFFEKTDHNITPDLTELRQHYGPIGQIIAKSILHPRISEMFHYPLFEKMFVGIIESLSKQKKDLVDNLGIEDKYYKALDKAIDELMAIYNSGGSSVKPAVPNQF